MVKKRRKKHKIGLSQQAFNVLSEFLDSEYTPQNCMDITAAHGLMTSLVIGPRPVLPSRWLPVLFGETEEKASFINQKHAQKIYRLLFSMYNEIAKKRDGDGICGFKPFLAAAKEDSDEEIIAALSRWCGGFVEGIIMEMEAWSELSEDEENNYLMGNILMFGTKEGLKEAAKLSREELLARLSSLPDDLEGIHRYWLNREVQDYTALSLDGKMVPPTP